MVTIKNTNIEIFNGSERERSMISIYGCLMSQIRYPNILFSYDFHRLDSIGSTAGNSLWFREGEIDDFNR